MVLRKKVWHISVDYFPCTIGKIRKINEGLKSLRNNVFDHEMVCMRVVVVDVLGSLQCSAKR